MQKRLTLLIILILATGLQGCSKQTTAASAQGTDTGNVLSPAAFSPVLTLNICQRIHECHPMASMDKCQVQIARIDGLPKKFGVTDLKNIRTMTELFTAETNLQISGDALKHISCISDVLAMLCSNPGIQNAYDSGTDSFSGTANIILPTGDCQSIY